MYVLLCSTLACLSGLLQMISQVQALLITLTVFVGILIATRLKVPLFAAILGASVVMGLAFTHSGVETAAMAGEGFILPTTIALAIVNILQVLLSSVMQRGGQTEQVVGLTGQVLRRPAIVMSALPALIGLLPMPGGALFSAPMVAAASGKHHVEPARLSAVNYWFRHIWEHWWPLYPGVLTAIALTGVPIEKFMIFQIPLGIFMTLSGLLILRRLHPSLHKVLPPAGLDTKLRLLWLTSSIWVIVLATIPASWLVCYLDSTGAVPSWMPAIRRLGPVFIGLVVSVVWTTFLNRMNAATFWGLLQNKNLYTLTLLVASVMVFQHVLEVSGAPAQIANELEAIKAPLILVVIMLPVIAGLVTGLAVGFVGTSFPIVLPLISKLAGDDSILPYVALAYGFGHMGQMVSPIHLCYIVSNQYFKTGFIAVYRNFLPSLIVMSAATAGYFLLTRWLF